jgi:hypothetical protein
MANRKMTYADLLKDKGTYAVKARREKHLAKFARHRESLKTQLEELDKAEKLDLEAFTATIDGCNAAAVAAIPLLPKKPKTDAVVTPDGTVQPDAPIDAPAPDGTQTIEIVDLETDTEALALLPVVDVLPESLP